MTHLLDGVVAIAAVHAQNAGVKFVAIRHDLMRHVAGVGWILGRIDQVEDDVGVVSGIAYAAICLLVLTSRSVRDLPRRGMTEAATRVGP